MFLIGMISFTAMASTPLTDQKQKTELAILFTCDANPVIVENVYPATLYVANATEQLNDIKVVVFKNENVNENFKSLAIIKDVGWCSHLIVNHNKKLVGNFTGDKILFKIPNHKRLENQIMLNHSWRIKRYC